MFKNEQIFNKSVSIYFNLNLNMILLKNLIFNLESFQVKDNLELLKNAKVNQILNIMQLN